MMKTKERIIKAARAAAEAAWDLAARLQETEFERHCANACSVAIKLDKIVAALTKEPR